MNADRRVRRARRNGDFIQAHSLGQPHAVPSPQAPTGRKCGEPGCPTILSRYNTKPLCYLHTPLIPMHDSSPRIRHVLKQRTRWADHGSVDMKKTGCRCKRCRS